MAERRPPGFNVDLEFYESDEVLSIPRRLRAAAIGVWTLCGSYSAKRLSDGYVSSEKLKQLGCTDAIRAALTSTTKADGTPSPLWLDADDGAIRFDKWSKWQRTQAEVKAYRDSEAARKRTSRKATRNAPTSDDEKMSGRTETGQSTRDGDPSTENREQSKRTTHLSSNTHVSNAPAPRNRTFAEIAGNGRPTPPPPDPGPAAIPARELVRRIIPDSHPTDTRGKLAHYATRLLADGTSTDLVEAGLTLWLTKPHLGPAALSSCVSEVLKTSAAPAAVGRASTKAQGILDAGARLAARFDQPNQEIEA